MKRITSVLMSCALLLSSTMTYAQQTSQPIANQKETSVKFKYIFDKLSPDEKRDLCFAAHKWDMRKKVDLPILLDKCAYRNFDVNMTREALKRICQVEAHDIMTLQKDTSPYLYRHIKNQNPNIPIDVIEAIKLENDLSWLNERCQ